MLNSEGDASRNSKFHSNEILQRFWIVKIRLKGHSL